VCVCVCVCVCHSIYTGWNSYFSFSGQNNVLYAGFLVLSIASLVTHASKIVLKMMQHRLEFKAEAFLGNDQFGFRRCCGTRDGIETLRSLNKRSLEHINKVYVCFVDYEKAFDRVNWIKIMAILNDIDVDWRGLERSEAHNEFIRSAFVRIRQSVSESCMNGSWERQGIFVLAIQSLWWGFVEYGIQVGGHMIISVRFADDKAVKASSKKWLQELTDNINRAIVTQKYGMKINVKKTKVMCITMERKVMGC